jgi:hypothetical protein
MPTQPLGTSTVFHAGIIGDGKRPNPLEDRLPDDAVQTNSFVFVSAVFKLCHWPDKSREIASRQAEIERRDQSKEACKQLALLLVDLVRFLRTLRQKATTVFFPPSCSHSNLISGPLSTVAGLPDFSWPKHTKTGKICIPNESTQTIPNGLKIYRMAVNIPDGHKIYKTYSIPRPSTIFLD